MAETQAMQWTNDQVDAIRAQRDSLQAVIERARLAERQALAVADARSIENVGLRAALKEIQALSLKTENANLVWQRATRALEE